MAGNTKTAKATAPKAATSKAGSKGVMVGKNSGKGVVSTTASSPSTPTAKMKKGGMVKATKGMMKKGGMC